MMYTKASLAIAALAATTQAHMRLENPKPWHLDDGSLTKDPLEATGANFPCKGVTSDGTSTKWGAGESQTVSFLGSAVHGGGSCQFSVTTDENPTANSDWRVIHSIIGGCPATADGNLPDGDDHGASKFNVKMPQEIPEGKYTFAWTWFNKIGNREMYMNCATVEVSGGSGDQSFLQSLPKMQVANIGTGCTTSEKVDSEFPNPGDSVETGPKATPGPFVGSCDMGGGSGSGSGSNGSTTPQSTSAPAASAPASSAPTASGGVFAPGASSAAATPTTLISQPAPTSAASTPAPSGGNSTGGAAGQACSEDGAIVCIGENQFGLCDHGHAVPQQLAAGMKCSNGAIQKRGVHVHRRHGSNL